MQQAIDEGFIFDILRNYTPYKTAFRLSHNGKTYATSDTGKALSPSLPRPATMTWWTGPPR